MSNETHQILESEFAKLEAKQDEEKFNARLNQWLANPNNVIKALGSLSPGYTVPQLPNIASKAYHTLKRNEQEMVKFNEGYQKDYGRPADGSDNLFHRKGMCEVAQNGYYDAAVGWGGGVFKEGLDLIKKTANPKMSFGEAWKDSQKDLSNNLDGLRLGWKYPEQNCGDMLKDFDWRENRWKNDRWK